MDDNSGRPPAGATDSDRPPAGPTAGVPPAAGLPQPGAQDSEPYPDNCDHLIAQHLDMVYPSTVDHEGLTTPSRIKLLDGTIGYVARNREYTERNDLRKILASTDFTHTAAPLPLEGGQVPRPRPPPPTPPTQSATSYVPENPDLWWRITPPPTAEARVSSQSRTRLTPGALANALCDARADKKEFQGPYMPYNMALGHAERIAGAGRESGKVAYQMITTLLKSLHVDG